MYRQSLKKKLSEAALRKNLVGYERQFVSLFGGLPGEPVEGFETSADQSLYLSNSGSIQGILSPRSGNTADRVLKLPVEQPQPIAEELYLSVLSRRPTETETKEVAELLTGKTGAERTAMVSDLIWALMMSSEFRFNH